jgi:hypothetical protein
VPRRPAVIAALATVLVTAACGGHQDQAVASSPTAQIVPPKPTALVSAGSRPSLCPPTDEALKGGLMRVERQPFCVVWEDRLSSESGFEIVLKYLNSGEVFVHRVPANATALVFPPAEAPNLEPPQCTARQVLQVEVWGLGTGSDLPVDAITINWECLPPRSPKSGSP